MRKVTAVVLTIAMSLALAACGGKAEDTVTTEESGKTEEAENYTIGVAVGRSNRKCGCQCAESAD